MFQFQQAQGQFENERWMSGYLFTDWKISEA
jgi:hypothetical protein